MNRAADAATVAAGERYEAGARVPLRLESDGTTEPFTFRGFEWSVRRSGISGARQIEYTKEPIEITVPRQTSLKITLTLAPPLAYIVPAQWTPVIEVLQAHGLKMRITARAWEGEVETYRCEGASWHTRPFEGRQVTFSPGEGGARSTASPGDCTQVHERRSFPAGSVVVPMDQRAARGAVRLLGPQAPDSLLTW